MTLDIIERSHHVYFSKRHGYSTRQNSSRSGPCMPSWLHPVVLHASVNVPWCYWASIFVVCITELLWIYLWSLQWRHNGLDGVSNHQSHHCLLSRLFGRRSKKISKLRVTGLCVVIHRSPGPVTRKMFTFDDVIMFVKAIIHCAHTIRQYAINAYIIQQGTNLWPQRLILTPEIMHEIVLILLQKSAKKRIYQNIPTSEQGYYFYRNWKSFDASS